MYFAQSLQKELNPLLDAYVENLEVKIKQPHVMNKIDAMIFIRQCCICVYI